jgi:hypothetical protein
MRTKLFWIGPFGRAGGATMTAGGGAGVGDGEGTVPAPGGSGGLFCCALASTASSNEMEKIAQRLIAKSQRWERMIDKSTRGHLHDVDRRLPAIALAVPAFDLRRRVPDPEPVSQRIADVV